ncbi:MULTISPECIES: hypothetical protein [Haloferax]|uniref:Uncharacterized protein n=1 Tax=Haloferax marinum TaxID=2666143 RepID=A0A6A8G4P2_9EURY|nr:MULTISPECIES: hypothetical protein [Haloferax]KAB1197164.1 hypothetical protein Hfx1150_06390 [Haloferax sp. CBA1150]MRW96200.1 hypothetical protein [Haloferax marinum]
MSRRCGERRSRTGLSGDGRGQLVLVSGAVVVVALFSLLVVHAQLAPVGGGSPPPIDDVATATDDAVEAATAGVAGRYDWAARESAVGDFDSRLDPNLVRIERAYTGDGGVALSTNDSAAAGWALRNCPDGPAREFGSCVADDGVVVQERAGETAIVAVAIDVVVATPETKTDLTLVVRPE